MLMKLTPVERPVCPDCRTPGAQRPEIRTGSGLSRLHGSPLSGIERGVAAPVGL